MNVLVALDTSLESQASLSEAERFPSGHVTLVTVLAPPVDQEIGDSLYPTLEKDALEYLQSMRDMLPHGALGVRVDAHSDPAEGLLEAARATSAQVLVVTTHGHHVAESLLRQAHLPVLVVHPGRPPVAYRPGQRPAGWRRILLPVETADDALRVAAEVKPLLAADGELLLLHVTDLLNHDAVSVLPDAERTAHLVQLERAMERVQQQIESPSRYFLQDGTPTEAILEICQQEDCDLVALHRHNRMAWERSLLGSITEAVARCGRIPILAYPPLH